MSVPMEERIRHLEAILNKLQTEVDTKMSIMEQILCTRNEQFVVQKQLLEQEHALYASVLDQWRSDSQAHLSSPRTHDREDSPSQDSSSILISKKRNLAAVSTSDRMCLRAKRLRSADTGGNTSFVGKTETETEQDEQSGCEEYSNHSAEDPLGHDDNDGANSDDGDEDGEADGRGMEKRVFVNFYSENPTNPERESNDEIWLHFLHEENGARALCKHCDEKGFHQIYQIRHPTLSVLRSHLKRAHKVIVEAPVELLADGTEPLEIRGKNGRRQKMLLRHEDYLYKRKYVRGKAEYWLCRIKNCTGRLAKRSGITTRTAEHNCLTTPQDCDAILFREKVREMAEADPLLPASELIAKAKSECTEDVLELLPNDESLRGTIRRIRHALESNAQNSADWT